MSAAQLMGRPMRFSTLSVTGWSLILQHASPYHMQLGLLGSEVYNRRHYSHQWSTNPTLQRLVDLTNSARQGAGLPPLGVSPALMAAAGDYSQVLAGAVASAIRGRMAPTPTRVSVDLDITVTSMPKTWLLVSPDLTMFLRAGCRAQVTAPIFLTRICVKSVSAIPFAMATL